MRILGDEACMSFREADFIEDVTRHNAVDIWEKVRTACIAGVDLVMSQHPAAQEEFDTEKQTFASSPQMQWLMKRVIAGRAVELTELPVRAVLTRQQLKNIRILAEATVESDTERVSNFSIFEQEARELGRQHEVPDYGELTDSESAKISDYFFTNYLEEIQVGKDVISAIDAHLEDGPSTAAETTQ